MRDCVADTSCTSTVMPGLHWLVPTVLVALANGQPLRPLETRPSCIRKCLEEKIDCHSCVKILAEERYSTPRTLTLPYHKAHPTLPDPATKLRHHHFLDRPPWVPGSQNESHTHGDGSVIAEGKTRAEGKTHVNCPAMRARSGAAGITIHMPYTVRFFRSGLIEVDCHWIPDTPTHAVTIEHPVDSPWIRLPQSHLQIFTVGDSRADVWIVNSGIYIDDAEFMASPGADPGDKGGSVGNKWLVLPLPHRLSMGPGWRVEQGIMSSFQRTSRNANIPLQLNFTAIGANEPFIEIAKGTPVLQYVPAVLPALTLEETPMPNDLTDYLVMLSEIHRGGDIRKLGGNDQGAYDVMRSYQLKENPGYEQSHFKKKKTLREPKSDL